MKSDPLKQKLKCLHRRLEFLKNYTQMVHSPLEQVEKLEQLRILYNGYNIAVLVTDIIPEGGVDTLEDLHRVRQSLIHKS